MIKIALFWEDLGVESGGDACGSINLARGGFLRKKGDFSLISADILEEQKIQKNCL